MLEILYQDEWLVAVNKPSGWLVHRSWLDRDEKVVVMQTVRDQIGQHVFTAHRLDRPTSGVLLMGLSSEAGRLLAQQFEQHQIQKRYHAIVRGWLMEEAVLDYPLPVPANYFPCSRLSFGLQAKLHQIPTFQNSVLTSNGFL